MRKKWFLILACAAVGVLISGIEPTYAYPVVHERVEIFIDVPPALPSEYPAEEETPQPDTLPVLEMASAQDEQEGALPAEEEQVDIQVSAPAQQQEAEQAEEAQEATLVLQPLPEQEEAAETEEVE